MSEGDALRQGFTTLCERMGKTIHFVGVDLPPTRALSRTERGQDYFSVAHIEGLTRGLEFVVQATSERWVIDDIRPKVTGDVVIKVDLAVHRAGHAIQPLSTAGSIIVHADRSTVAIQQGGAGNVQRVEGRFSAGIQASVADLRRLIANSSLQDIDKEEVQNDLTAVESLAIRERSTDVIERAERRLSTIQRIVAASTALGTQVGPIIEGIRRAFSGA